MRQPSGRQGVNVIMGVNVEQGRVISGVLNKNGWKVAGIAKKARSNKSINCYSEGRCFVIDIADLLELIYYAIAWEKTSRLNTQNSF